MKKRRDATSPRPGSGTRPPRPPVVDPPGEDATGGGDGPDAAGPAYRARFFDSAAFAEARYPSQWLVESVLVKGQPGVIGGPRKSLKTSVAVDLAISLGAGVPFLGRFRVPRAARVAVASGESGAATMQETARRVCAAKGVDLASCPVHWSFDLPGLNNPADLRRLRRFLEKKAVEVVIIDPLYLCLLGGGGHAVPPANLYEVGPLLRRAGAACLAAGATPILVHHATKRSGRDGPVDLDDLAFAGVAEYVRQWLLLGRREPYRPGTGEHRLRMVVGGSAGHSGHWDVDVREGTTSARFTGRRWGVVVRPAVEGPREGKPVQIIG